MQCYVISIWNKLQLRQDIAGNGNLRHGDSRWLLTAQYVVALLLNFSAHTASPPPLPIAFISLHITF